MKSVTVSRFRPYAAIAVALLFSASSAFAYVAPGTSPDESNLSNHDSYTNRDGNTVHAPARSLSGKVPQGATARCRDGTYSFSRHRSGTCSRHGGVADWL
ncbi:DUF3761 domain-containing protein [Paraburkholderia sp. DD10]|jgi:hypothetical protein|uniref:DUF3761 domain-containing protein n=1 Tax=Paraburkholderia terricola TaxID=169427 RepID=A0ABU1LZ44_9BURK|nr:DUF3761 domain-containing protein [Paraburkholderia terricola]AXE93677.1 hypothetical protein CUJ90_16115 [Paraburkholderia terricola]MDR6412027.1 hypothetical protein [Paraburkholderia terricola]MDR6449860.1 hypothetical protein [Paraburkholderia terricola]MDR6484268.1 hypothetical protein [Paraburkholderia terricola]